MPVKRRFGLSLVELLVAFAIIAVLVGLLLSAISLRPGQALSLKAGSKQIQDMDAARQLTKEGTRAESWEVRMKHLPKLIEFCESEPQYQEGGQVDERVVRLRELVEWRIFAFENPNHPDYRYRTRYDGEIEVLRLLLEASYLGIDHSSAKY